MKKLTKNQQIKFYEEEIKTILVEYKTYLDSKCIDLINKSELWVGAFEYVDKSRNQIVFSFPKERLPSTKIPLTATKPKSIDIINSIFNNYSYTNYRKNHVSSFTECYGVYYQEKENEYYVGFSDFDIDFLDKLDKKDKIVFSFSDPPLKYYFNLIKITKNLVRSQIVEDILLSDYHLDDFEPKHINNSLELINDFKKDLFKKDTIIIQGPPGTGKTFFISRLISLLSKQEQSILVATLANRSLIELAKQFFENKDNKNINVFKSNLTLEESKEVKNLKTMPKDFYPSTGDILLTTFYKMTGIAVENINKPIYDYIILEEASQCFIGTIAAAKLLGKKVILVGDPLQLPPIVNQRNPKNISLHIDLMERSFTYYASTIKCPKYRFTTTYRFSKNACFQTNSFYENSLNSISKIQEDNELLTNLPSIYNKKGGSSLYYYDSSDLKNVFDFLFEQINILLNKNSKLEIAVLSSTKKGVKLLRDKLFFKLQDKQDQILINTVDGVQGLTVDFCYYFAFSNASPSFSFKLNRFNVATSRARYCTVILLDKVYKIVQPFKGLVAEFISKCSLVEPEVKDDIISSDDSKNQDKTAKEKKHNKATYENNNYKPGDIIDLSKIKKAKKEIVKGKENIYIIDTNVFVDQPNIISKIDEKYKIVLSAKVIDELDSLKIKLNQSGKNKVQDALRIINKSLDKENIEMVIANLNLLPNDFDKKSPDNLILSVALKFKSENPIILTSDIGLQVKAKGLEITTITLKDFLRQLKY
jgi:rRNA-processing protein FCF1